MVNSVPYPLHMSRLRHKSVESVKPATYEGMPNSETGRGKEAAQGPGNVFLTLKLMKGKRLELSTNSETGVDSPSQGLGAGLSSPTVKRVVVRTLAQQ